MQFVVFMELMGTIVLPIAITLTYSLIINSILHPPKNFSDAIPLILLAAILGLPAILILATSRKVSYVFWMLIYLVALPVWNFVLPLYAFWHCQFSFSFYLTRDIVLTFLLGWYLVDDFSWGETRKVQGEAKSQGHDEGSKTTFDANTIPHRRWEDWER
jgi:chitin synthase